MAVVVFLQTLEPLETSSICRANLVVREGSSGDLKGREEDRFFFL